MPDIESVGNIICTSTVAFVTPFNYLINLFDYRLFFLGHLKNTFANSSSCALDVNREKPFLLFNYVSIQGDLMLTRLTPIFP